MTTEQGDGWAVGSIDGLGSGPGFRKMRSELRLGDERRTLGPGGLARVDPAVVRSLRNTSDTDEAVYVCVGGADGYVGRDGISAPG